MLFDKEQMYGLSISAVLEVIDYYEACCTAEFILDNWPGICEDAAFEIAREVRARMHDEEVCSGEDESRIIGQVIAEWREKGYAFT
jgi:hypothetical protein